MSPEPREPQDEGRMQAPPMPAGRESSEDEVRNIVGQIDPKRSIDRLNHSLKGEHYLPEQGRWVRIGESLINNAGRGWIISFLNTIMNNASTMGIVNEDQFSSLMIGVIKSVTREFRCNLEKFGFVPPGNKFKDKIDKNIGKGMSKNEAYAKANEDMDNSEYENKGNPDTERMSSLSEMMYQRAFIIYSRSLKGSESKRIFGSLQMKDPMEYNKEKKGWLAKAFGG